jgi:hypothetical protein
MSERVTSLIILLAGITAVVALWVLSILFIRRETEKDGLGEIEQKAWLVAAIGLPLFGFALYLFLRVMQRYLTPQAETRENGGNGTMAGIPAIRQAIDDDITPLTIPRSDRPSGHTYGLVVEEGPHVGQQFNLKTLPAVVGRGPDSSIPLDADLNVSRRHAEMYEWNGMLRIRDLGSSHGTWINGEQVTDHSVAPGDRIGLGVTVLKLQEIP